MMLSMFYLSSADRVAGDDKHIQGAAVCSVHLLRGVPHLNQHPPQRCLPASPSTFHTLPHASEPPMEHAHKPYPGFRLAAVEIDRGLLYCTIASEVSTQTKSVSFVNQHGPRGGWLRSYDDKLPVKPVSHIQGHRKEKRNSCLHPQIAEKFLSQLALKYCFHGVNQRGTMSSRFFSET